MRQGQAIPATQVVPPGMSGHKCNPFNQHPWRYYDIDPARRAAAKD